MKPSILAQLTKAAITLVLCFQLAFLSGCATDQQRTVTGGTVIGAVGGAVVGGLLGGLAGALTGADRNTMSRYIAAGAVAGMVAGGVAGYRWGKAKARRKADYARTEDYLGACINDAQSLRVSAQNENAKLRRDVQNVSQQTNVLVARYNQRQASQQQLITMHNNIARRRSVVGQQSQRVADEIAVQRSALQQAGAGQQTAQLQGEINALSQQKQELEQHNRELASISGRLGI